MGEACLELGAERVGVAVGCLQVFVEFEVALDAVDCVNVGDEVDDVGDVLLQVVGNVYLNLFRG